MTESSYRIWAKVIAILELVLNSIAMLLLILGGIALLCGGLGGMDGIDQNQLHDSGVLIVVGIVLLITIALIVVFMWFSYNLLKAATIGTHPTEAIRRSKRWRIFAIIVLVLSILSLGRADQFPSKVVGIAFRILFIWVVHMFIKDLETEEQQISKPVQYSMA